MNEPDTTVSLTDDDSDVVSHFNYMLGAAQADLVRGDMVMSEMAIDRRMSDAVSTIHAAVNGADDVLYALNALGIPAAKRLAASLDAIIQAADLIRKCQSDLVTCRFNAAEQSTTNMMNAVLATVKIVADKAQP
jgi:hypothetical protein